MPNAAMYDDDLGYGSPARKSASRTTPGKRRSGGAVGKAKKGATRRRFDLHKVARFAAIGMGATMAIGIMVNALLLQKGHHPAPLFGKGTNPVAQTAKPAPTVPQTKHEEAEAEVPPTPAKPRKALVAARDDSEAPKSDDAIGHLLAGGGLPASARSASAKSTSLKSADGKSIDGKTVTGAQRALTKLGFKVPATGAAGPATKKAIEAFEKDRHMPVKGELSHKMVKVLAAESGIKMD